MGGPVVFPVSQEIIRRCIDGYLAGRVDYGALHLGIIQALADLADRQHKTLTEMTMLRPPPGLVP